MKNCSIIVNILILIMLLSSISNASDSGQREMVKSPVDVFIKGYIKVYGSVSIDKKKQYRAARMSKVIAHKKSRSALYNLPITGDMSVSRAAKKSEDFKKAVSSYLGDVISCANNFDEAAGYASVCLKLSIRGKEGDFYTVIYPMLENQKVISLPGPLYKPKTDNEKVSEEVVEYDSLIIDVREMDFKPAFVNRLVTPKNEVLYTLSHITRSMLAQRGMGGYTQEEEKAKEMLKHWGASRPMIVKPQELIKNTDIRVSRKQAEEIFISNKKGQFLENACVVFLFKIQEEGSNQ